MNLDPCLRMLATLRMLTLAAQQTSGHPANLSVDFQFADVANYTACSSLY
jgi:hypothetical protein